MAYEIPSGLMVSVSGVRGRVGEALTPEVVARFAAAYGAYVRDAAAERRADGGSSAAASTVADGAGTESTEAPSAGGERPRVVVARDSRTSGRMFKGTVISALQSVGCDVIDLDLAPTPTTLLAVGHHGAQGAVIVTASHNPVEWNALKLASGRGTFLDADQAERMRAYLDRPRLSYAGWDQLGEVVVDDEAIDRHLRAVLETPYLDVDALRRRRFKVALDCVRGAGGVLLPRLLESLGCEVVYINGEPDGRFPREPEPVPANLGELERLVAESGADVGLATDPDADRLAIVGEHGEAIGEDYTLAFAAELVLRHRTGPVVTNLSTSRLLDDVAEAAGVELIRAPVGEINVVRRMQSAGAVVGGEGNGGVILPDVQHTRDSAVAAALVLQLLLETGETVRERVAGRPAYAIVKAKVPRGDGPLAPVYAALEERLDAPERDTQDGLRLAWPAEREWLHVRPSGTEPILRLIAESSTRESAESLVARAEEALEESEPASTST